MTTEQPATRPWAAVAAATALNLPLGSIYAFSVFLKPIEAELHIPRAALSMVFGLATVGFTAGMNLGPLFYRVASPAVLILGCALVAAAGIGLTAAANGLAMLILGYGVLFGVAGGAIYIILQQAANLLVRTRPGLLNGYILGLYPAGAMIAAPVFGWINAAHGYRATLQALAAALLLTGALSAWLTVRAGSMLPGRVQTLGPAEAWRWLILARLCAVFFLAAASGLMVLSQAAGIVAAYGGGAALAVGATTALTGAIACARVTGGSLVDRFPVPFVAAAAHLLSLTGAVVLSIWPEPAVAVAALGTIGVGYGLVSGSTAGAIAVYWPKTMYGRVAGKVYIAWCVAAVTLPVLAGHLFDLTGGYRAAMLIAGAGNLAGLAVAAGLPRRGG